MNNIRRHTRGAVGLLAAVALAFGASGCGTSASDAEFELTVTNFNHIDASESAVLHWFLDEVEERSEGRVEFERYDQEQLCSGAETTECVRDGRADIGATIPSYKPGEFEISEIMNMPFQSQNAEAVGQAYAKLLESNEEVASEGESMGLKQLWVTSTDVSIFGATEPIEGIDGLANMRSRSAGEGMTYALEAIGASPVNTTASEMYEAMQNGVIDVWFNLISGGSDYNLFEVSEHWRTTGFGTYINVIQVINQETWDSLPDDIQQIFNETVTDLNAGAGYDVLAETMQEQCDKVIDAGTLESWETWDDSATDEWENALGDTVVEEWKSNVEGKVDDPDALREEFLTYLEEAEASSDFVSPAIGCSERV